MNEQEKLMLKKDIQGYYLQLTLGCGEIVCNNPYCASNPKFNKLSITEAIKESFKLSQYQNKFLHRSEDYMDLNMLKQFIEEGTKDNYVNLKKKLGKVFFSPESANISFLKVPNSDSLSIAGIDLNSLQQAYNLLKSLPGEVETVLANAFEGLSRNMKIIASKCTSEQSLRQFFLVLESPFIADLSYHNSILSPLNFAIAQLPSSSQQILMKRWEMLSAEEFGRLVGHFQQFITLKFYIGSVPSINSDRSIEAAVKVLSLLYNTNEKKNFISYKEFYNEPINENLDPRQDFINWKQGKGFSLCSYPFMLDPAVKSQMLNFENLVQQMEQRNEAIRNIFSTGVFAPVLVLRVYRQNLIQTTLSELSKYDPQELKKELKVHFVGEEAIDEGGVQKEWFQLLCKEIFDPKYGMFISHDGGRTLWFNSNSTDFNEFQLIGTLLGLAIYNGVILDLHFPNLVYKKLTGLKSTFEDLKEIDYDLYLGFEKLLKFEGDVEEIYDSTFQIIYESFGELKTHELKPEGSKIRLTNENRKEYVDLYVNYLLEESVEKQVNAFLKGFRLLCDSPGFRWFRSEELQLLICGNSELDFEALEKVTKYEGYSPEHEIIKGFWEIVHSMSIEEKKKLLSFTTGSDRAPIGGLGKIMFVIVKHGDDSERLPSAHTCFNHLLIPQYSSKQKLKEKLNLALNLSSEGFGML